MRIQHNIPAMSSYRNYTNNVSAMSKNLERLSSGYKINRAGDDAAGLAISEKMRAQITGLEVAQKNAKDGISLVQTAEGALTEVHDMLNRMYALAEQSANGTYDNDVDRYQLQKEVDSLRTEINRIADSANFNGINLLDGSLSTSATGTTVEGMERIITTVIGKDDVAHQVAGKKTILDGVAPTPASGSFVIDLAALDVKIDNKSAAAGSITVTIGDDLTLTLQATANTTPGSTIANFKISKINGKSNTKTGAATVTLNGVEWTASIATGSAPTITFTQKKAPTTASQCKTNFDVKVAVGSKTVIANSTNKGVYTKTPAVMAGAGNAANTVFRIDKSDIVDGAQITIGSFTVTLAVGPNSAYAAQAGSEGYADLTTLDPDDIDLNRALAAISAAFGSSQDISESYIKGFNKAYENGSLTVNIGVNDGSDGGPVGITIQRASAPTAASEVAFNSLKSLAGIFKMTVPPSGGGKGLTLQIGDTAQAFNQLNVGVNDCHAGAMGIGAIDISTQDGAADAMGKIKDAINYVSDVRGGLGALQNRLDHTINNLSVMQQNIQDAESTIRDVDIAEEMMAYTKNNILVQSAQAMLAQANQLPQGVLQLLQ